MSTRGVFAAVDDPDDGVDKTLMGGGGAAFLDDEGCFECRRRDPPSEGILSLGMDPSVLDDCWRINGRGSREGEGRF